MNLFMILYTATGIGGVWGPLPYDLKECLRRKEDIMHELNEKQKTHNRTLGWRFECELHTTRPQLPIQP